VPHPLLIAVALSLILPALSARGAGKQMSILPFLWRVPAHPLAAGVKLMNLLERRAATRAQRATEPAVAVSCDRDAPASDFMSLEVFNGPAPQTAAKVTLEDLSRPAARMSDLFDVIRTTRLGRAVLEKFLPQYGTQVAIRHLTPAALQSATRPGLSSPLAFYRHAERSIYVDRAGERGRVAFVLLHEIIHSLDNKSHLSEARLTALGDVFLKDLTVTINSTASRLRKRQADLMELDYAKEDLSRLERRYAALLEMRDIHSFRAERLAHDSSFDVWKELAALYPGYYRRELAASERAIRLRRPADVKSIEDEPWYFDDDNIIRTSGLDPDVIAKFKSGRCVPLSKERF
jgi:hypothetical protein